MTDKNQQFHELVSRQDELEAKIMFQQDTIDNLNSVVTEQWKLIDKLKLQIQKLDDQLYELETSDTGGIQKPPHY
ncbi:SlyX family protein [Kordiimonas sp. SCSIO 12610]|uniref:SlyX family protein n=1 Tax=Kordiimonas sp. SCSIO 12610 TaxID=2829597 RepID=UPI0021090EC5|nr:SlyX family protein [Kordiimonas sp. SCSIO 12610]UTW55125.1 SlyX family protein [Kordiimonas sp. SCSIO 12610]